MMSKQNSASNAPVAVETAASTSSNINPRVQRIQGMCANSLPTKYYKIVKSFLLTFTLSRDSLFYYAWLWIVSAAVIYNALMVPMRASFVDSNLDHLQGWFILDYLFADVVYLIDMVIRARTTFFQQGIVVTDTRQLLRRYVKTWQFAIDLLSILPTDLIYLAVGPTFVIVRLNRLLRIGRFFEMTTRVESTASFPNVFRMATTVFGVLVALHYTGIFYHSYSKAVGFGEAQDEQRDFQLSLYRASLPFFKRYTYCMYWATMTLCFIGEMPHGHRPHEQVIQAVIWLLGLLMFGAIVGRIGLILNNVGATTQQFQLQVDAIRVYLNLQKVSSSLTEKVMLWFGYAFENRVFGGEEKCLKPLPNKMKAELASDMHLASLKKVQLFADLDNNVLTDLVVAFKLQTFSPGDFVCKKGDIGREMYVVKRGKLEVVSDDGSKVFVTLGAGSVFGEISLLNIPGSKTGNRRTANVRSKGYSDLFSLSKDDLYLCLQDYPEAMKKLVDKGLEILRKENKIDEDAIINKQRADQALLNRITYIEKIIEETETRFARLIADIGASRKSAIRRLEILEQEMNMPAFGEAEAESLQAPTSLAMSATPANSDVLVRGLGAIPTVHLYPATPTQQGSGLSPVQDEIEGESS